eukprot:340465_1
MLSSVLFLSHIIIFASSKVTKFGFSTNDDRNAATSAVIKTTLWFNRTIFSCELHPKTKSEWYYCEENSNAKDQTTATWSAMESDPICNEPQYKIMIDNSQSTDPVIIDNVAFWTKTTKES